MSDNILYQYRTRPTWGNGKWSTWENCSPASAADYRRVPVVYDWEYEVREFVLVENAKDAGRYRKLRNWMSSNVPEGWQEVENLGAVAAHVGCDEFDRYLDSLPECNVGLCEVRNEVHG